MLHSAAEPANHSLFSDDLQSVPALEPGAQPAAVPLSTPLPAPIDVARRKLRLRLPQRDQASMRFESLDQRLDADHPARAVWAFVEKLDLSEWLDQIQAVEGAVGRDANDPRILFALWLMASVDSVSSARKLEALCREHRAYEWICGEVSMNYHTLADFRTQHADFLERTFAESIAALTKEGLVDLNVVSQDGMRIRASAGSDSFRREATLEEHLVQAEEHLRKLREAPHAESAGRHAAQARAAREKVERLNRALDHVRQMARTREARHAGDGESTRASSTDPEARRMKMPDGGTRPAVNAQFVTDVASGLVVAAGVTNAGVDAPAFKPMLDQTCKNTGRAPKDYLGDGSYTSRANVDAAAAKGTKLHAPLRGEKQQLANGENPYEAKRGDNEAMTEFRERMGTPESKALYKLRGESAEWTNARARAHGLYFVRVRGLTKVRSVLLFFALAHNLQTATRLRAERATAA